MSTRRHSRLSAAQSAGGLLDIVITSEGPAIAGTWAASAGGLDAAVWLPRGRKWLRQESAGTALANTPQLQVAPRAASAAGSTMIISGSVITFGDGAEQRAAVWTWPTRSSAWTLQQLPDAGTHSEALSSRCAETCWVSGHADGNVALWSFDPAHADCDGDSRLDPAVDGDRHRRARAENCPIGRPARSSLQPCWQHPALGERRP